MQDDVTNTGAQDDAAAADNQADDSQGLLGKVKNVIPGDIDDKLIDSAQSAVAGVTDKADEMVDKVTDAIPGELDDKLVDGAKDAVDKLKDMNPLGGNNTDAS